MSYDDMENYRNSLEHIVRPEDPDGRMDADSITLEDYEALYLKRLLVEYSAYEAETATEERIALGLAEYINMVVVEEQKNFVNVYHHSDVARRVIRDALVDVSGGSNALQLSMLEYVSQWADEPLDEEDE
jgi:hypothetical protein